jgi:hypothetical protein
MQSCPALCREGVHLNILGNSLHNTGPVAGELATTTQRQTAQQQVYNSSKTAQQQLKNN